MRSNTTNPKQKHPGILNEFINALDQEIDAIKSGRGGSSVKIFGGRFLRQVSGFFAYAFHLENFLSVLEDSPAEIEIEGKRYKSQVLLSQGLQVEIGVECFVGKFIAKATLYTNLWYLLEMLKKKYIECQENSSKDNFRLSDALFSGALSPEEKRSESEFVYSLTKPPPNNSQKLAIKASFYSELTIIWGPPGTGKTSTVAKAIEAHLNAGRKILLVSHANNAVDEALKDIAEQLKPTPFYQNGKLVRLGKPSEKLFTELENQYPLVLLENISSKLGESLTREKSELDKEGNKIEESICQLEEISNTLNQLNLLVAEVEDLKIAEGDCAKTLTDLIDEQLKLNTFQRKSIKRLSEAEDSGKLKRFFRGLDPQKIQNEIDRMSIILDSKKRQQEEIHLRQSECATLRKSKGADLQKARMKCQDLLKRCGLSEDELANKMKSLLERKDILLSRIAEINRMLDEIQKKILLEASLIATTLTKTFSAKDFPEIQFDVLILDEASMAPLPYLYWALGRCKRSVTIVGDFLQLPPICISNRDMAEKWLGRSIFTLLGITRLKEARSDSRIKLLDTQYRMHPKISEIPNRYFYERMLKDDSSTDKFFIEDGISDSPLVLIDSSELNPWCSRLSTGGRFNLYHALVCMSLAKQLAQRISKDTIGIVTPYAAQARLINKISKDWGLADRLRISTIHRFQGGEESVIIFDLVEGAGTRVAPMLDDTKRNSDARLILNVAITRAKSRLYFIAHGAHLLSDMHSDSVLARIINNLYENAEVLNSESFVDQYLVADFEKWAGALASIKSDVVEPPTGALHTEKNFYPHFFRDLKDVKKCLVIVSPFITVRRATHFMDYFRALRARGVELQIYTRPIIDQIGEMADQAKVVIEQLRAIGAKVIEKRKIHNKTAILDNTIAWDGSLNILSHRDSGEHMWRFEAPSAIEDIIRNLELDEESGSGNLSDEICPICGKPMIYRKSRYGKFLSCSTFPKCKGKIDFGRRKKDKEQRICPNCGKPMVIRRGARGLFYGCSGYPACKTTSRI